MIGIARQVNMNVKEITLNIVENLSRTTDNDLSMTLSNATFIKNKSETITFKSIQALNEVIFHFSSMKLAHFIFSRKIKRKLML